MMLPAADPTEFLTRHVVPRQAGGTEGSWCTLAGLLAGDAAALRAAHRGLVEAGHPPKAAANYLVGWVGGGLGRTVGFVWAMADAGVLVDERVRWRMLPGGWPDLIDVGDCRVVVGPGHPWSSGRGVDVLDPEVAAATVVGSLVTLLDPLLRVAGSLARVGRTSLWSEVADGIAQATAGSPDLPGCERGIGRLEELLAVPDAPWRRRASLWTADSRVGPMVVTRRGGCCLAYTTSPVGEVAGEGAGEAAGAGAGEAAAGEGAAGVDPVDPAAAYAARFPREPDRPAYCADCRFREPADVEARQVCWAELVAASSAPPGQ